MDIRDETFILGFHELKSEYRREKAWEEGKF